MAKCSVIICSVQNSNIGNWNVSESTKEMATDLIPSRMKEKNYCRIDENKESRIFALLNIELNHLSIKRHFNCSKLRNPQKCIDHLY